MMRAIILVFATLLLANATLLASGPTFVQVKVCDPADGERIGGSDLYSGTDGGNLNIVVVGWNDTTSTVSMVSDSLGNNYALAIGPTTGTGAETVNLLRSGHQGGQQYGNGEV